MTETPNLHLTKDAPEEYYSVDRVNANSDKIDTFAGSVNSAIAGKQDSINDLDTIRAGAAAGATAVQPADMTSALAGKVSTSVFETDQQRQDSEIGTVANAGAKNVLKITERSRVHQGVTFTVNNDESVSISGGTTASNSFMRLTGSQSSSTYSDQIPLPKGRYKISCPGASSSDNFRFAVGYRNASTDARATVTAQQSNDFEAEFEITTDTGRFDATVLSVSTDSTYSAKVYPMIRRAEIKDDTFVPYAPTNRELYEMILALQQNGGA